MGVESYGKANEVELLESGLPSVTDEPGTRGITPIGRNEDQGDTLMFTPNLSQRPTSKNNNNGLLE